MKEGEAREAVPGREGTGLSGHLTIGALEAVARVAGPAAAGEGARRVVADGGRVTRAFGTLIHICAGARWRQRGQGRFGSCGVGSLPCPPYRSSGCRRRCSRGGTRRWRGRHRGTGTAPGPRERRGAARPHRGHSPVPALWGQGGWSGCVTGELGTPHLGSALTHTRLPVPRWPVAALALAAVTAQHVQAHGEGAALAQTLGALVHIWGKEETPGTPMVVGHPRLHGLAARGLTGNILPHAAHPMSVTELNQLQN